MTHTMTSSRRLLAMLPLVVAVSYLLFALLLMASPGSNGAIIKGVLLVAAAGFAGRALARSEMPSAQLALASVGTGVLIWLGTALPI
jgi:hypothetical protein